MKNDAGKPNGIQIGTTENDDVSPPPSPPPPMEHLWTDTTPLRIGQGMNSTLPISLLPTRNNKAGLITNTVRPKKRQRLLLPKSTDQPPIASNNSDDNNKDDNMLLAKIQQIYGNQHRFVVCVLVNRKRFVLVINGFHLLWRARFFLVRTYRMLGDYPYRQQFNYYRATAAQLGKLAMIMVKKEQQTVLVDMTQRQNKKLVSMTLGSLLRWVQLIMVVVWARLMAMSRLNLQIGYRVLKYFGSWDSLALAFISVALTRSQHSL